MPAIRDSLLHHWAVTLDEAAALEALSAEPELIFVDGHGVVPEPLPAADTASKVARNEG